MLRIENERNEMEITSKMIQDLMAKSDYSESDLASKVGVSEITVRRWLNNENKPQGAASKALKRIIQKSLRNVVQNAGA
jgi:DNA-binding transcriptional regulator YiaG